MKRWNDLIDDQRNELIASTFFGWKPVQCNDEIGHIVIGDHNEQSCSECGVLTDDWFSGEFPHGIIPHSTLYTFDVKSALQVAEKARTMLPQASLTITLGSSGVHYSVNLVWAISVQDGAYSYLDTKHAYDDCGLDRLADTICSVVAQAVGVVENELEC